MPTVLFSPAELISLSKVNRQIDSQDAQRMTQKGQYASIRILLFVRRSKDDDEAKAFYFLGAMHAAAAPQPVRLANGQSAFEMHWRLERPWKRGFTSISPDAEAKAGHAPIHKLPAKAARVIGCAISPGGAKRPS